MTGLGSAAYGLSAAHDIQVQLFPSEKRLNLIDRLKIHTDDVALMFSLSRRATSIRVEINAESRNFRFEKERLYVPLNPDERSREISITIRYSGIFDDPVPLQPVNTDNPGYGVSATISEVGSFLLAGSYWYPQLLGSRSTYRLKIIAPDGMIAVTAGRSLGHTTRNGSTLSEWQVDYPVEGLSLSVAAYIVREKAVGKVMAATYLLEANQHLADAYMSATAGYLKLYADLFGPYPFQKFAVVENFFPTGFGFPSYTLLGGTVLRLPFIVQTSLGHEIAHCWWGNGVYVDYDQGNWGEALTTYVADYLYKEQKSEAAARSYRQQILRNYATLVKPQNDFALHRFRSRYSPLTKTIGYDRGAMVFHMLRQKIGDKAFWEALRTLYRDRLFQPTSWQDLQNAFEKESRQALGNFFNQWVYRKGAPSFYLEAVTTARSGKGWKIGGSIVQKNPYFQFDLKLLLETREHGVSQQIRVNGPMTQFELYSRDRPLKLAADPDAHIMRRLFPQEIPPAINSLKSSPSVRVVLSEDIRPQVKKAVEILIISLGLKKYEFVKAGELRQKGIAQSDILLIGNPGETRVLQKVPNQVAFQKNGFRLNDKVYDRPSDSFFGVFAHPFAENRVIALFWPLSSENAEMIVRKITHYGKYSYLVFEAEKNRAKGFWPIENSPLVYRWE
jgi:hypothetical protein